MIRILRMVPTSTYWLLLPLLANPTALGDETTTPARPTLVIGLGHPDRQLEALLHWFAGARHASPAAALAAWRVRPGRPEVLGKGAQAAIAALNPEMVRELRALDGAVAQIGPADGVPLRWWLRVPNDDGTLASFATALALGGGARLPQSDLLPEPVDRLGPGGAPLLLQRGRIIVLGSAPSALQDALSAKRFKAAESGEGLHFALSAEGLRSVAQPPLTNLRDALGALGIATVTGRSLLDDEGWTFECRSTLEQVPGRAPPRIPGRVLEELTGTLPPDVALAAAVSFDRGGRTLGGLYSIVEHGLRGAGRLRGDANLRSRVNLAANALGFFPELELWPRVEGVGGWLATRDGQPTTALVILRTRDAKTAASLAERLILLLRRTTASEPGAEAQPPSRSIPERGPFEGEGQVVGSLGGRPVRLRARGAAVRIAWGDPRAGREDRLDGPGQLASGPIEPEASRLFLIWPGRLVRSSELDPEIARVLADAPPVVWTGRRQGAELVDTFRWRPLGPTVRGLVDTLPALAPPP
jgi:hypothetical protein